MTNNEIWEPLWKNRSSKLVSKDESIAIEKLKDIIRNKNIFIETVLGIEGEKTLRFKKKYGTSSGIDLYDYVLLGPVLFNEHKLFCRQSYSIGKADNNMSLIMNENEIAMHVKESLFNKKVLREAREDRSILQKLYDKSS